MRIAIIAPPFIPVPPERYGGTELFIAELACGLKQRGVDVVVYANGASTIDTEKRWLYREAQWPLQGAHLAVEVARRTGIPLKIAGEVQPIFQDYFDSEIRPHLDGKLIEYIGEADLAAKNELLGNSLAMLFPIQWDEPFGLVMIE